MDVLELTLGELIFFLEYLPEDLFVEEGFGAPHSDRGCYEDLAFEPEYDVSVESMLNYAKSAVGQTFTGWKGGEYTMTEDSLVKIAATGNTGESITTQHIADWQGELVKKELRSRRS